MIMKILLFKVYLSKYQRPLLAIKSLEFLYDEDEHCAQPKTSSSNRMLTSYSNQNRI